MRPKGDGIIPVLIGLLLLSSTAWAEPSLIQWNPNPPAEGVADYVVYWGATSRADQAFSGYDNQQPTGGATELALDVPVGTYLAVTAETADGASSGYSAEIQTTDAGGVYTIPSVPGAVQAPCTVVDGLGRTITLTQTCSVTVEGVQ